MSIYNINTIDTEEPTSFRNPPTSSIFAYSKDLFNKNINQLSNHKYISADSQKVFNTISFPTKVTKKGITKNSISVIDSGDSFGIHTYLIVQPVSNSHILDNTEVALYLKINDNTINSLSSSSVADDVNLNKTHLLIGPQGTLSAVAAPDFGDFDEQLAIVSFDIDSSKNLVNPQIIREGSFIGLSSDNELGLNSIWASSIEKVDFIPDDTQDTPLAAVAKPKRVNTYLADTYNQPADEASLSLNLILNDRTVVISGGQNYAVGDTFTVAGGDVDGSISVTEVDSNGAITSTSLSNDGNNFTSTPVATYDNATGSGATISYNDTFLLYEIIVDDGGAGYTNSDTVEIYPNSTSEQQINFYNIFTVKTLDLQVSPATLNDVFSIDKIEVLSPGYNHQKEPKLTLIDTMNNIQIADVDLYLSSNTNFFQDNILVRSEI